MKVNLIATVVRPSELEGRRGVSIFTIFADVRLLGLWLKGATLPFSGEVIHLFEKQLEEGGLLVINKSDLVTADEGAIRPGLERCFPGNPVLLQSVLLRIRRHATARTHRRPPRWSSRSPRESYSA